MTPPNTPKTIAGKPVGQVGYGMMNLTMSGKISHEEAIKPMKAALEKGANFWNAYPEDAPRVVLSLKGAYDIRRQAPDCSAEGLRAAVDEALRVLDGAKTIDLFECARIDPEVPVETMVGTLVQLMREGKIGSYGLSEVSPDTVRRAHAVHPPAAVEEELSLFTRHVLDAGGVADTCRELGVPLVGYSPMGAGWLTGQFKTLDDLPADDYRRRFPRFQPGAFERNVKLVEAVEAVAQRKGCTSAQIAIAWYVLLLPFLAYSSSVSANTGGPNRVLRQGVIAIPGATKVSRVEENCKLVELTDAEAVDLQKAVDHAAVAGDRYPEAAKKYLSK
ncbi:NADP-dependent oxidoreductase domain-containing protein [Apiospora kogelbergensis]|uniref:NADP-dependent oxidoreductase domain-containing protein n=1 Tax=Apiospora kogelbergensis TaxID=1337665 RepID=UPI0031315CEE